MAALEQERRSSTYLGQSRRDLILTLCTVTCSPEDAEAAILLGSHVEAIRRLAICRNMVGIRCGGRGGREVETPSEGGSAV